MWQGPLAAAPNRAMYSYESRIRSLEEVVGLLLARQGPGPFRLVPLAPLPPPDLGQGHPPLSHAHLLRDLSVSHPRPLHESHASKDVVVGSRDPLLVPPLNTARRTPSNSQIDIGDDRNHHPIQDSPSHSPATLSLSSDLVQQWANTLTVLLV
ncbi:hypothetical protein PSHT_02068 [Puccinia striiformis]|uniref:Uncharacterized protein n=1 Tax=Puccinia striiformis TaxID=27350 RepID=A0A2S4WIX3_9BASI|nr:hypothetical protein PSHT_02068 [Puccinia striiformis]